MATINAPSSPRDTIDDATDNFEQEASPQQPMMLLLLPGQTVAAAAEPSKVVTSGSPGNETVTLTFNLADILDSSDAGALATPKDAQAPADKLNLLGSGDSAPSVAPTVPTGTESLAEQHEPLHSDSSPRADAATTPTTRKLLEAQAGKHNQMSPLAGVTVDTTAFRF